MSDNKDLDNVNGTRYSPHMEEIMSYRWYNEDAEREKRAIRDERLAELIGQWKDTDELKKERAIPITTIWQLIKTLWTIGGKP